MSAPVMTEPDALAPARPSMAARVIRGVLPYVLALVLAFAVAGIVIAALGYDPVEAFGRSSPRRSRPASASPRRSPSGCR